jgi:ribonuclease D
MKSAWRLNARALAALRNLCDWRESEAVRRDKPRSWIVDDASCLAVAAAMPADSAALQRVDGVRGAVLRRYGDELLQAVRAAQVLPDEALPEPLPAPLDNEGRQQLKRLKAQGKALAAGLGVAPEALLPARDYEQLLREHRGGRVSAAAPLHWQGWRSDRVIEPLRAFLRAGQSAAAAPGGEG